MVLRGPDNVFISLGDTPGRITSKQRDGGKKAGVCYTLRKFQTAIIFSLVIVNLVFALFMFTDGYLGCNCEEEGAVASGADSVVEEVKPKVMRQSGGASEAAILDTLKFLTTHYKSNYKNPIYFRHMKKDLPADINLDTPHWQFNMQISNYGLYMESESANLVDKIVHSMGHNPIVDIEQDDQSGTELKLIATFSDGTIALMKPQRMKRDEEVNPNLYVFSEFERHHSEIAAHHLDRILGFNRVPPCTGRMLNITSDILPFVDDQFAKTVHKSPAGNVCFYGQCVYFCDIHHPYCGDPDSVEVSACLYLPTKWWPAQSVISPWRRSYGKGSLADWQEKHHNASYCHKLLDRESVYSTSRRLLDVVDMGIFDFLTGNTDRHHYVYWPDLEDNSSLILFDNGRGFGRYKQDDYTIIPALYQCCQIRQSTYDKFMRLKSGDVKLSEIMRWHMKDDPLTKRAPILVEEHLLALDRRVELVLEIVHKDCLHDKKLRREEVIIDDSL